MTHSSNPTSTAPSAGAERAGRVQRVGLRDVAKAADVSIATVSMALADHPEIAAATKRRIWQLTTELGYRAKQRPRLRDRVPGGRTLKRVGFMSIGSELTDSGNGAILQALVAGCNAQDIRLQLSAVDSINQLDSAVNKTLAMARDVDGLLLIGWVDRVLLAALNAAGVSNVVIGHAMIAPGEANELPLHMVASDEIAMGHVATDALLRSGHRRIGFVCELLPEGLSHWRWRAGYAAAHLGAGRPIDPALVFVAGKAFDNGEAAASYLFSLPHPPTGFIAPDPRIAAGFLAAAARRGSPIANDAIVIASEPTLAGRYGVGQLPRISYNLSAMATMGLRQLQSLYEDPTPWSSSVIIPFTHVNLPKPTP
jgi:DNA-binding LacI/PurR family transcriptional regulator